MGWYNVQLFLATYLERSVVKLLLIAVTTTESEKSSISVFTESFASICKMLFLGGRLGTRV